MPYHGTPLARKIHSTRRSAVPRKSHRNHLSFFVQNAGRSRRNGKRRSAGMVVT